MDHNQPQHHEMQLQSVMDSGAEEWFCPVCGRRFLLEWPPKYKKIILEVGDEYAIHTGGKNEPGMFASMISKTEPAETVQQTEAVQEPILSVEDQVHLNFWEQWMEENEFENLWTRDLK